MTLSRKVRGDAAHRSIARRPLYALPGEITEVPRYRLPEHGMDPDEAYQIVHDELMLDGNARLNLATFVSTWMEPAGRAPDGRDVRQEHDRQGRVPADRGARAALRQHARQLWHSPDHEEATGCSTTGSSEAAMLGGLALKWRWQQRQRAAGRPTDRPNLVMGAGVQVCWEKFCRYFDVEPRLVPWTPEHHQLSGAAAAAACDENTIGVVAIMGVTYDGAYEPVAEIAAALDELQARTGLDVPIHVDGASGGFVAPFLDARPGVGLPPAARPVDQRLGPQVRPRLPGRGLDPVALAGGAARRPRLPRQLPGRRDADLRPQLLAPGRPDRGPVLQPPAPRARGLPADPAGLDGHGAPHGRGHRRPGPVPDAAGQRHPRLRLPHRDADVPYDVFDLSRELRGRGWQVPAYTLPPDVSDVAVLRIVVRNGFSADLGELFLADLERVMAELATQPAHHRPHRSAFHH